MSVAPDLPLPPHYSAFQTLQADYLGAGPDALFAAADRWRETHRLPPAAADTRRAHLLVIDMQVDFCFPSGALYVAGRSGTGGTDALRRVVEFIYRRLGVISEITCTLDSHLPHQVFFPGAHLTKDGDFVAPYTTITAADYRAGRYRPNPALAAQLGVTVEWLTHQFTDYCTRLEASGKYALHIWPYHCLIGTAGHRLAGALDDARLFHAFARGAANAPELKGDSPLTEHYSVFAPEVATSWDGRPLPRATRNMALLERLLTADAVLVAGLASSHCVAASVADLLAFVRERNPYLAHRIVLLRDAMAPVVAPGADFTDAAEAALAEFQAAGARVLTTTDPVEQWWG
ncbi:MAG: nicotinamidase [Chloracidobacterium sp.]|nr:nicotinamidase [Chloracidobacterium sp.]MDW8218309.1 nicotinamidase [Acidobacteriota bacterium]